MARGFRSSAARICEVELIVPCCFYLVRRIVCVRNAWPERASCLQFPDGSQSTIVVL